MKSTILFCGKGGTVSWKKNSLEVSNARNRAGTYITHRQGWQWECLTLNQGTYRLDSSIIIKDAKHFVLDGNGSVFIFTNCDNGGFEMIGCSNVTLKNFTIDFDPLPFTQGTVVDIAANETWFDVYIDKGYRTDLDFFTRDLPGRQMLLHTFDPVTGKPKTNTDFVAPSTLTSPHDRVFRFGFDHPRNEWTNIRIGDMIATSGNWRGVAIRLFDSAYTAIEGGIV